jgi:16S rRNA (uracil1498-N3)-methyltransferase
VERWRRIAREASEQSRRVAVPEIASPVKLVDATERDSQLRIVMAENERESQLVDVLRERPASPSLALAIGPEGGWAPEELQLFNRTGWISASLGPTILRAETAAIAGLAVARAELG